MTHNPDLEILLQLKYCERCGGLFFRPQGTRQVFCAICVKEPDAVLRHRERPLDPKPAPARKLEAGAWYGPMSGVVQSLQGVSAGGAA